jgi:ribosomal protein L35
MPSVAAYMRWGKGPKQRLRFTKSGDRKIEEAYERHFVWPGKGPFHRPAPKETRE